MRANICTTCHPIKSHARTGVSRRGSISPKAIIAVVVFLVIFGLLRYATMAGPDYQVLETKRVNGKDLGGNPIRMEAIKFILSSEATGGLGGISGISAHLRTAPPGGRGRGDGDEDADKEGGSEGTEGVDGKIINIEPDPNGNYLFVKLRLSRDYLEKQGKISNLLAVVSTPDIQLVRGGNATGGSEPVFIVSGLREQTQTGKGTATQYNFGGGNTITLYKAGPSELWLASGQIKQAQELSNNVDVICLFGRPPGEGELTLQILGTPNVSLVPK